MTHSPSLLSFVTQPVPPSPRLGRHRPPRIILRSTPRRAFYPLMRISVVITLTCYARVKTGFICCVSGAPGMGCGSIIIIIIIIHSHLAFIYITISQRLRLNPAARPNALSIYRRLPPHLRVSSIQRIWFYDEQRGRCSVCGWLGNVNVNYGLPLFLRSITVFSRLL